MQRRIFEMNIYINTLVWIAIYLAVMLVHASELNAAKPAILFHTLHQWSHGGEVDLDYLAELHAKGFEVDYSDKHADFKWERIKQYNCIVLTFCPAEKGKADKVWLSTRRPPYKREFIELVDRYLEAGGGVFMMAYVANRGEQLVADMIDRWGAKIPIELIKDPKHIAPMTHMPRVWLAFTDQVFPSPVSEDVKQIWYPYSHHPHYNAGNTNPLWVSQDWQVVVRASKESVTVPVELNRGYTSPAGNLLMRKEGVKEPPLFAIRTYKNGRIALCSQYPQFSFGQGTKWLYNREVLSRGLDGKPSHFGRLLENTFRWLTEPSLKSGKLGGYQTDPERLKPPNTKKTAKARLEEEFWGQKEARLHRPPRGKLYRGVIGIQTSITSGRGTVAEFAAAAKEVGLNFIALIEDFKLLTPAKLEQMKKECKNCSDADLKVFPGYAIDNDIGNHLFIFGIDPPWPPEDCLTGTNKTLLNQQYQDEQGKWAVKAVVLNWLLYAVKSGGNQIGFYDFAGSGDGMKMKDLRTYGMAALRFYRDGKLVEDKTEDYLLTAQGTIPPSPAAVSLVRSPEELKREVAEGHSLTYGQARSLDTLFQDALRYGHQYDGLNVFLSDGPLIQKWPECYRVHTYAQEDFVTGRNIMPSPIHITSDVGLREIRIYDGQNLFWRVKLNGEKDFQEALLLNGTVHKNLVLIAEDTKGGRAVSYARRCWKVGDGFAYCGDRVNDCGDMLLAHGPVTMRVTLSPTIHGGATWDGGPKGRIEFVTFQGSQPLLITDKGTEGQRIFNQTPLLEFTDEGARVVRSVRNEIIADEVPSVNPWHTYGPIKTSRLFEHIQRYAEWHRPTVRVLPTGHAGYGLGAGIQPTLFSTWITFKKEMKIDRLRLLQNWHFPRGYTARLVVGVGEQVETIALEGLDKPREFLLMRGDWFGVFSPDATNSHLFISRSDDLLLRARRPPHPEWLSVWALLQSPDVKVGDRYEYEIFTLGYPVDVEVKSAEDFLNTIRYLREPEGLEIIRGRRIESKCVLELEPANYAVELKLPRPKQKTHLPLPIRVHGLNRRWSAGLFQRNGYVQGHYGGGTNRYRPLGIDLDGAVYVPAYVDYAEITHLVIGHPIVAGPNAKELFIQVVQKSGGTHGDFDWHVAVNNPTDRTITTTLRRAMDLPGIKFDAKKITMKPGTHVVIQE